MAQEAEGGWSKRGASPVEVGRTSLEWLESKIGRVRRRRPVVLSSPGCQEPLKAGSMQSENREILLFLVMGKGERGRAASREAIPGLAILTAMPLQNGHAKGAFEVYTPHLGPTHRMCAD